VSGQPYVGSCAAVVREVAGDGAIQSVRRQDETRVGVEGEALAVAAVRVDHRPPAAMAVGGEEGCSLAVVELPVVSMALTHS